MKEMKMIEKFFENNRRVQQHVAYFVHKVYWIHFLRLESPLAVVDVDISREILDIPFDIDSTNVQQSVFHREYSSSIEVFPPVWSQDI